MEADPFFDKSDFAGVPSQRSKRPIMEFEAAIDRAVGELLRADGACGVDLWSAWPTFDGMHRMGPLFPTLFEKRPHLSPGYVKRVTTSCGNAVDLRAWWRHGSVKQWPLKAGVGPLPTDRALRWRGIILPRDTVLRFGAGRGD